MAVVENKKVNKGLILLLVFNAIILAAIFPTIQSSYYKIIIQKTKKEKVVTKTLNAIEIARIIRKQKELANIYDDKKTQFLFIDIYDGADTVQENYMFMLHHYSEYDMAMIKFPVTKYKVNGKTVEFISNTGKITQVHSESGWEDYK